MLYENENYVPMGFTYDYYITEESYETTIKNTRANLLMRALVLSEEDAEAYGKYLKSCPTQSWTTCGTTPTSLTAPTAAPRPAAPSR